MDLTQPSRPYATEGRKTTHDFLSLYSHSPVQQDPRPSSHGGFLKTHNFLQPLEKEDKNSAKGNTNTEINVEKPTPEAHPSSGEHVLHGGIGTYSISHISCFNPRMPKPEGSAFTVAPVVSSSDINDDNSNCSSYTAGSSFPLWEESSTRKGKTGKENSGDLNITKEQMVRAGHWLVDRPSESSSNHRNSFSARSSSQPPAQKSQSFLELLNSAEGLRAKEEDDDEGFTLNTETTPQRGDLKVKVDGKGSSDQKANTPRSKHSATEQRRRCKINDRFQMLRQLIPNSDQKRDKASFLLEVVQYIQFLQEKVTRYEGSHPGWSNEPAKLMPWGSSPKLAEIFSDQPRGVNGPVSMFNPDDKTKVISSTVPRKPHNSADPNPINPIKSTPIPVPLQKNIGGIFPSVRNNNEVMQPAPRVAASDAENASLLQPQLWQSKACPSLLIPHRSNQDLAVEGGTINISSTYSQGLLNTLTQALKSSGVDLSRATISVQVDIGKRANAAQNAQMTPDKEFSVNHEVRENRSLVHERVDTSRLDDRSQAAKRLKMVKS